MSDVKAAAQQFGDALENELSTPEGRFISPSIEHAMEGFERGASWQLAQLRCETCSHFKRWGETDYGMCSEGVVCQQNNGEGNHLGFGCVIWEGKE